MASINCAPMRTYSGSLCSFVSFEQPGNHIPRKFVVMENLEHSFHMAQGKGEHSYAKNSRAQVTILSIFNMHAQIFIMQYAFVCTISRKIDILLFCLPFMKSGFVFHEIWLSCSTHLFTVHIKI